MVKQIIFLAHLLLCGVLNSGTQDLPKNEAHLSPTRRLISVDEKASFDSEKWFSSYQKPELGTIASLEGGWINRAHVSGVDCEFVFQWLEMDSFLEAKGIHDWMKFPNWSHISLAKEKLGGLTVYTIGRGKLPNSISDRIYVASDNQNRVLIARLILLNHLQEEQRIKLIRNLIGAVGFKFQDSGNGSSKIPKNIKASMFVTTRNVPATVAEAARKLVQTLSPIEREHLLKSIKDEPDLLDHWPTVDGQVNRLHWMTIYWGLNDPSSPLRRDMRKPGGLSNGDYILDVLRHAEKLLKEKS